MGALDSPPYVETEDVVGAFPDGVHLGVAQQACHRPSLDIAVAAVDFDRVGRQGDAEPADLQLGDGHGYALAKLPGLSVVDGSGAVEHERLCGFDVDDHLGQLASHQRLVDQCVAERLPALGIAQRLDQGPSRIAECEQRDAKARSVCQLHHSAEALAVRRAGVLAGFTGEQKRLRVDELDLTRGDRAGAELVLEATHPHAVARAVATRPKHEERRDTAAGVRRPLGLGEYDERLAVAVRREPLESVEQPRISAARGRRLQRTQVGSAGPLGQQLGGLAFPFTRLELGQHVIAHIGWRVRRDQSLHHATAGAERTAHADVGLVEQIVGREQRQRRTDACTAGVVAQRLLRVQHRAPRLLERGRHDDAADVVAPAVVAFEPGRVAVGLLGPPRDRA